MNTQFNKTAPVYKLILNDKEEETFVDVISLIEDDPAIMIDWVSFSEHNPVKTSFQIQSEEKRRIMSPVLLPNQYILRFDQSGKLTGKVNGEYYITIDQASIEKAVQRFFKAKYNKTTNFNQNHNPDDILSNDQVYIFESWITSKKDKSSEFGFNLPVGTWMVTLQIDDKDIWNKIKAGELTAISMEGMFNYGAVVDQVNSQFKEAKSEEQILVEKVIEILSK